MQHDASGNLKTKGQTSYQWDVRDRLIGISGSGVTASFSYDALGRRTSKTVNGQTLGYQYDGADIIQDSSSQYLQGLGIDDVLSRTNNSNNEYYLKDHLGSTVALADQSGNLATQYSYSPYGQVSKTGTSSNYFTYTGREDDSTGLYYYRARYYSPDLKRFTAEDPIGFESGQSNLYGYAGNSPAIYSDPTGYRPYPNLIGDLTAEVAALHDKQNDWAFHGAKLPFLFNTNKCNQFVGDVLTEVLGKDAPRKRGGKLGSQYYTAGDWANPNINIPNWAIVKDKPRPGDVIAIPESGIGFTGHVGIVGSDGASTFSASAAPNVNPEGQITKSDWGFRDGQSGERTVRRYSPR
jgi:RHS repeat-associated protein